MQGRGAFMGRIELEIYTPGYVPNGREVAVIETARGTVRAELFGRETPSPWAISSNWPRRASTTI